MRARNYSAWELDPADFDSAAPEARMEFLVRFGILAPSSHNSQPWKFAVGPDAITVAPEAQRFLPESDEDNRQLYISLGCAIENLVLAADYYGYRTEVVRTESDGLAAWLVRVSGEPLPASSRAKDHPALAIPHRKTNRDKYDTRPPETAFLEWMRTLSDPDLHVHLVQDGRARGRIAEFVAQALVEAMDSEAFRFELSRYIHPNITHAKVGMPMDGFGMPMPLSFIAPFLVRRVNVNKASRQRDEELLSKHTPAFGVIATTGDDPEAWMRAGRTYERITLEAERCGISTAPMAAAIQIGDHYKRLQGILNTELRPQVFFRIGYASSAPRHSPRLTAEEVIKRM